MADTHAGGWLSMLQVLVSPAFIGAVGLLLPMLLAVGTLTWLFERRRNSTQFGGGPVRGIGNGLWWAAVTATTVGYGDKSPVTPGGRIIGLIWMFAALIAVASFTAAITSALTIGQLAGRVRGPDDLPHVRVASVAGTTSAQWLQRHHIGFRAEPSAERALAALNAHAVDAVVFDAPLLRYLIGHDDRGALKLLPQTIERQDYVMILPPGSNLRKPLDNTILQQINDPSWLGRWVEVSGAVTPMR